MMSSRLLSSELRAVLDAYQAIGTTGFVPLGNAPNYRQIRPSGWPRGMHYEFLRTADAIGVELHLESDEARSIASTVESFARRTLPDSAQRLQWEADWTYGPRLFVKFPLGVTPDRPARAMVQLIELTFRTITLAL